MEDKVSENMTREELLILFLHLPSSGDKNLIDPIRIMKGIFLINMEVKEFKNLYKFEPYLYGPCSFEIYSDLKKLIAEGIIKEYKPGDQYWSLYYLTEQGTETAEKILKKISDESIKNTILKTKKLVTELSFVQLLNFVYKKYPNYAKKSIFNTSILKT